MHREVLDVIRFRGRRDGMSLAEVMIAIGLLAAGALAVLGMFPTMAQLSFNTVDGTSKLYLAQNKMDELLRNNTFISQSYSTDNPFGSSGFRRWRGVPDPYGDANVQVIEVEVSWVYRGRTRDVVLYGQVAP